MHTNQMNFDGFAFHVRGSFFVSDLVVVVFLGSVHSHSDFVSKPHSQSIELRCVTCTAR